MKVKIKFGDVLVILAVILSSAIIAMSMHQEDSEQRVAVISQNNAEIGRIYLDKYQEPYTIPYSGQYPGIIEVNNGKVRFKEAQCPDQVCVHTGWIEKPGEIAVCLPSGIIIKIEGYNQSDVDIIVK